MAFLFWAHVAVVYFGTYVAVARWCDRRGRTLWTPALPGLIALALTARGKGFYVAVGLGWATLTALAVFWLALWAMLMLFELAFMTFAFDRLRQTDAPRRPDHATPTPVLLVTGRGLNLRLSHRTGHTTPPRATVPPLQAVASAAPATAPAARVEPGAPAAARAATATDGLLRLQGLALPLDQILVASAEEHDIRLATPGCTRLLRGRMADVEAQMPAALGMRVHLSHWVARRAVVALRRGAAGWTLALVFGREVPVARARQAAARAWIDGPTPAG